MKMASTSKSVSNKELFKRIINNLEFFPAIWDNSDEDFHKHEVKQRQLQDLAVECGTTTGDASTKYKSLRTRFRKVSTFLHKKK